MVFKVSSQMEILITGGAGFVGVFFCLLSIFFLFCFPLFFCFSGTTLALTLLKAGHKVGLCSRLCFLDSHWTDFER